MTSAAAPAAPADEHAPGTHYDAEGKPTAVVTEELAATDPRLEVPPTLEVPRSEPVGRQTPTYLVAPLWTTTAADDAIDLAAVCGLDLLPWQQLVLRNALGERGDRWAAFEVGLVLPRQNGKNVVLLARQLAGLFLFQEEQQVHTAHKFKTATGAHRDLVKHIRRVPELRDLVKITHSSENMAVAHRDGYRIDFLARHADGGRGLSGDTVYLDEAFRLSEELVASLLPTLSARPRPQVWYTSSAGMEHSTVLEALRKRALEHPEAERFLCYLEWSVDLTTCPDWRSVEAARISNPSLGYFQSWDWISGVDLRGMDEEQYKRERLGIWADKARAAVIAPEVWRRSAITADDIAGIAVVRRSLALEVTADRDMAVLAGAAELEDGRIVIDILEQRAGTAWCAAAAHAAHSRNPAHAGVVVDSYSGAAAVAPHLIAAGTPVSMATTRDLTTGTADFYDRLTQRDPDTGAPDPHILHARDGSGFLDDAALTARRRLVGTSKTAWTWAQGPAQVTLAPLRAVTLAVKGLSMDPVGKPRRRRVA
ncbi:hypothetical protein [Corynebacterium sphenisci]|uniref:hypothetical protein n=1 Tax=Corynebacterium sphenisci TaxID=191493 RepID=UPI000952E42F|nr:hypothetical protein [Corynebacterium sphenisci]